MLKEPGRQHETLILCVGWGWSSSFSAMSVSPFHYLGGYFQSSTLSEEYCITGDCRAPTLYIYKFRRWFCPIMQKITFWHLLFSFRMLHAAEGGTFFFFLLLIQWTWFTVPISVLGPDDSKVHKTLTEMQRKGDTYHNLSLLTATGLWGDGGLA